MAVVLAILIIGAGYFVLKYLMLHHMARGGHFYYSGSDGINFSTDGQPVSALTAMSNGTPASGDAACGDGGGSCGGE